MKLLNFISIALIPTIVSSTKCKNPELLCIELCCELRQVYLSAYNRCKNISKDVIGPWHDLVHYTKNVEFVVYGKCETSNDSFVSDSAVIDSCHGLYYHEESRQYTLQQYFNVPCDRSQITLYIIVRFTVTILMLGLLPIFLPFMIFYTCTRGKKKDSLSFKLVTWYLTSVAAALLAIAVGFIIEDTVNTEGGPIRLYFSALPYSALTVVLKYGVNASTQRIFLIAEFFFMSTFLWLSVLGYEIWIRFKAANVQSSSGKVQKRFRWYSTYVWGSTTVIVLRDGLTLSESTNYILHNGALYLTACFNVISFLVLSLKICLIRCRVAKMTNEKYYTCHIIRVILRLCIMMGIPRMLFIILHNLSFIGAVPTFVMLVLEPYVVFLAFVAKKESWCCLLCSKCCCCSGRHEEKKELATAIVSKKSSIV